MHVVHSQCVLGERRGPHADFLKLFPGLFVSLHGHKRPSWAFMSTLTPKHNFLCSAVFYWSFLIPNIANLNIPCAVWVFGDFWVWCAKPPGTVMT